LPCVVGVVVVVVRVWPGDVPDLPGVVEVPVVVDVDWPFALPLGVGFALLWPGGVEAGAVFFGTGVARTVGPLPLEVAGVLRLGGWAGTVAGGLCVIREGVVAAGAGRAGVRSARVGGRAFGSLSTTGGAAGGLSARTSGIPGTGVMPMPPSRSATTQIVIRTAMKRPSTRNRRRLRPVGSSRIAVSWAGAVAPRRSETRVVSVSVFVTRCSNGLQGHRSGS
jgi:hypothetical protein